MPNPSIDLRNRPARFAALEDDPFDLLVIGAGITGCGVARDAAMRGLRVALVDANDLAAGTSSRSSKLVHGGLRYLAAGQVTVVREAATERKILRRIAPHLAQTNLMLVPGRSKPALLKFKAAMAAYEKLGDVDESERYEMWTAADIAAREPTVNTRGLAGAVVYPEYLTDDARLTIANARSAAASGAAVLTHAPVTEILVENGRAVGAVIGDALGQNLGARIRARAIVNAAGPWLDAIRQLEDNTAPLKLQLTKGIHVTFPRAQLPIHHTVIMTAGDKRSTFVVPRGQFVYFGTTDTFHPDAEYYPGITRGDIEYLLEPARGVFNNAALNVSDIVSLWSGVRPLLAEEGRKPAEISRRHEILEGAAGVLSVAGGKLTSYRSMAARIVDEVEQRLGHTPSPCTTADEPLPGGETPDPSPLAALDLPEADRDRAWLLYGGEGANVYATEAGPAAEARFAVLHEGAVTLEDYWMRRSARARFDENGGLEVLEPAAHAMAGLLGWTPEVSEQQCQHCRRIRQMEMAAVHEPQRKQATGGP